MIKKITHNKLFLPFLEVIYIMVIVFSGLIGPTPRIIAPLGLFIGIFYFFMAYSVIGVFSFRADLYIFVSAILGSCIGTVIILGVCQFISKEVCSPIMFRSQMFGNFAFPLSIIVILWITIRVPLFFKKNENKINTSKK